MKSFLKPKFNFLALALMWLVAFAVLAPAILSQVGIAPAKAAYNGVINYQGKLTNTSNVAVADGTYNMRFKLYDTLGSGNPPTGGTLLWTETRTGADKVQVTNGVFSVMLGDVNNFTGFDFNQTLFLSVDIGGTGTPSWDGEMAPRKKIGAVPVAFLASNLKGTGVIDITNTGASQQIINYDGSNRLTVGVASDGFTTLTSVGTGAGFNLTGGNVGIGSATASAKLHVTAATEQLRVGFDAGNYTSFTTSAGGDLTIAPSGSDLAVTGNVDVSGTLTSGTGNAFNVDASGNVTAGTWQGTIVTSVYGGTGNGFTKFSGPATSEKTFTLPDASATILTTNTAVTPAQGGTGASTYTLGDMLYSDATNSLAKLAGNTTTTRKFLRQTGNGSISAAPAWDTLTNADVGLGNVENTALSTWAGTTNITTLGTITSGTWSGSTVQVNKGGTGTTDGSITGSGALTFTGTGGNLLLRTTTSGDVNFQPASFIANVGGGTSRTALHFLEPSGTGSDYAAIQSNANVTTSYTWTLPAADDSGCIQSNGSGTLSISACGGGSQTPWTEDIDAASYNLFGLSNLLFGETAAAPASSDIAIYSTSSNLILNTPSGKSLLITNDGSTEYNFSPSALNMSSNNITGLGTAVTGSGAVTITGTSGDLSLVTATSGNVNLNSAGGTIELQDATNVTGALDVSTTLNVGTANAFQVDAAGAVTAATGITMTSGNFLQNGTGTFSTGSGAVSLNGDVTIAAGKSLTLTAGVGTIVQNFQPLGTTAAAKGLTVTPLFTLNAADQTLSSIYVNPNTNSNNDTGDILYGLNVDNITASSATETAIRVGTGWDTAISTAGNYVQTSANTTQTTTSSAMVLNLNSLTTGTGLYAASSTLGSGKLVDLQSTSANSEDGQVILNISSAGTATDAINTMYGAKISNTISDSFIQSTNVALYLNASGGGLANYGLIVNAGSVGLGTTAPDKALEVNSSNGNNLRLTYGDTNGSATNYADLLMSSGGDLTIAPSGSDTAITGNLDVSGTLIAGTANAFQVSSAGAVTAVGVNAGAGLLQGSLGLTVTGATANINASGTSATNIGNSTGALVVASGGTSSWTNTSGNLTISTATSGTLAVTSAAVLNLTSGGTSALNLDSASGTVVIATGDALQTAIAGSPGTLANGQIWYDSTAGKYKIYEGSATKVLCNTTDLGCGAGGSTTWDTIGDPGADGSINMGETTQTLDWDTLFTLDAFKLTDSGSTMTSGSLFKVTSATTGAVTNGIVQLLGSANFSGSGGLLNVTANSTTAGVVAKFSGTGLTTGVGVSIAGGTAMTTGSALRINSGTTYVHTTAETGDVAEIAFKDASTNTSGASITNGLDIVATVDTSGAGTKTINALNISAPTVTGCASGACTFNGLKITGGTGSIAGMTSYGAYIDAGSGSGTEYAAAFMNGNVGIGTSAPLDMLQVGSAINRGDITVYGDINTLGATNLTAIAGIKDVFVYDTTGDSDGGRWIDWATTEQLSWYTETKDATGPLCNISSNDRCGDSSFPRKATLVVTADSLYIFDSSNNTLWMKFSQNASGYALGVDSSNDPSSVTALNGVIYVGTTDGAGGAGDGLFAFDFINDRMWNYDATDRSAADLGIGSRNSAITYNTNNDTTLDIATVGTLAGWETINDVFAVTPNITITASAIGAATNATPGYGNTYVGLATNSGVTIINITQGKLVQYSDATDNDYTAVHLTKTGRMYALNTTLDQLERWDNYDSDGPRATRVNGAYSAVWDQTTTPALSKTQPNMTVGAPDALDVIERASSALETEDLIYVGHSLGMTEIHGHTTTAAGWVKWYDTTRQTMLQHQYNDVALPLDETSGTNADSATIVDNDMTYKGTYTMGASGVRGKGINLGGAGYLCSDTTSDGGCDVDTAFNMSTVGWTITMWFNHTTATPGAAEVLFDKCYTAGPIQATGCVQAYMTTGGLIGVGIDDDATWTLGSSYDITATSVNRYNDGQWHMLTMSRTNANDLDVYVDGNALNLSNATGLTTTVDGSQIVALGAACNATANCATAGNFWNGSIDDFTFAVQTTTLATLTNAQQRRLYNDARPLVNKRVITVDNATTATSTTIGDSGESWQPNEFAGLIVTLTGDTGSGQTRRVTSNTATVLTVSPAFDTAPDTTTDFEVDPEALYGSSNIVTAIGITNKALLGEARLLCAGTDSTTGTGGVTCYNHQAGPNVIADIYHGDAKKTDDIGTEWTDTDTDSDDIRAIDLSKRGVVIVTDEHMWSQAENIQLGQSMDYLINQFYVLRNELVLDGVTVAGSTGIEIGFTGGADLAEYYNSRDALRAGDVVAIDPIGDGDDVIRYTGDSGQQVLGVVASKPAIILGARLADGYPIALTGRIPVNFSNENGEVKPGDYIAPSSIEGHAMRATGAGVVLGKALAASNSEANSEVCNATEEPEVVDPEETPEEEPETTDPEEPPVFDTEMCGKVMMFVELGSFPGLSVEQLMEEMEISLADADLTELPDEDALLTEGEDDNSSDTKQDKILSFLKQMKTQKEQTGVSSQILTDRLSATFEVISPSLVAEGLQVATIGTDGRSVQILGDLEFIGRPYLNSDSGGFAKITTGARYVDIEFEKEYVEQPTVNVTITIDEDERIANESDAEIVESINVLQDAETEQLFGSNVQFLITRKSVKGFRIIINQPAPQDITFSWLALAVKQPRLTISESVDPSEIEDPSEEGLDTIPIDDNFSETEETSSDPDAINPEDTPSEVIEDIPPTDYETESADTGSTENPSPPEPTGLE